MQKFTKKPVTISAWKVPPPHEEPSPDLVDLVLKQGWAGDDEGIVIPTLEGDHLASPGDYIIKGVAGEFYPCKPDIFEKTYLPEAGKSEAEVESMIQAAGKVAPRLTPEHIDSVIESTEYHHFPGTTVTVCMLTLKNGFKVIAHSTAVSPENFDEQIGQAIAFDNARNKVWELEGYLLKERLYSEK